MVSFDGNTYTGSWKDDKRDGQGSYQRKNGEWQYTGSWEQGKRQGPGHIKYSNGDVYSGDFKLDMFHGEGKMHYAVGCFCAWSQWHLSRALRRPLLL